jgi:hypothetical protein
MLDWIDIFSLQDVVLVVGEEHIEPSEELARRKITKSFRCKYHI